MVLLLDEKEITLQPDLFGLEGEVLPPPSNRRRPGRVENAAPTLLPLLRKPWVDPEAYDRDNDMRPTEGIAVSVLLSALPWAFIGGIILILTR